MNFISENINPNHYTNVEIEKIESVIEDFTYFIPMGKFACGSCGKQLPGNRATIYDHDGGWNIIAGIPRQWISFPCSCGYETSLNKLGVSR
jgi:hypothetical protein